MKSSILSFCLFCLVLLNTVQAADSELKSIAQNYEQDIVYIENVGQIRDANGYKRPDILFHTRFQGVDMYITNSGISYVFRKTEGDIKDKSKNLKTSNYRLDMEWVGINEDIRIKKDLTVKQKFNYYTPEHTNGISPGAYKKLIIENIYNGIDLVYYVKEGRIKYDFLIKAGADAGNIRMKYEGAEAVYVDRDGSLIATTPMGEIKEEKPYTYYTKTERFFLKQIFCTYFLLINCFLLQDDFHPEDYQKKYAISDFYPLFFRNFYFLGIRLHTRFYIFLSNYHYPM